MAQLLITKLAELSLKKGPIGVLFAEDTAYLEESLAHQARLGCRLTLLICPDQSGFDRFASSRTILITVPDEIEFDPPALMNRLMPKLAGQWVLYHANREFFSFPFSDTRSLPDFIEFLETERRVTVFTMIVDCYARDLAAHGDGVDLQDAAFDRHGYFSLPYKEPQNRYTHEAPQEQLSEGAPLITVYGGLRWRYARHLPKARMELNRAALFKAHPGLLLSSEHRFNDPVYNSLSCPWHRSPTAALLSFRTAHFICTSATTAREKSHMNWSGSVPLSWRARQLLELGIMEPGQWF